MARLARTAKLMLMNQGRRSETCMTRSRNGLADMKKPNDDFSYPFASSTSLSFVFLFPSYPSTFSFFFHLLFPPNDRLDYTVIARSNHRRKKLQEIRFTFGWFNIDVCESFWFRAAFVPEYLSLSLHLYLLCFSFLSAHASFPLYSYRHIYIHNLPSIPSFLLHSSAYIF